LAVLVLSSCKKNLPDVGGTSAQKVANEWWVTFKQGSVDLIGTHVKISTYNTAANNNEIWVDDLTNTWQFKVKAQVDYSNLTFKATAAKNEYYNITVDIANGKVLVGQGRSKTGNVTDSIYMEAKFSDDPGTVYTLSGHARTRFSEDEY
jgi:hypothetical protein